MSDHAARLSLDEDATSGACSSAHQSSWMSHWMKRGPKPASVVNNSSLMLKMEDDFSKSGKRLGKEVEEMPSGIMNENLTKKTGDFLSKINSSTFSAPKHCQDVENASTAKPQIDHEFGDKAMSLALSLGKDDIVKNFDALQKSHLRNSDKRVMSHAYSGQKGGSDLRSSAFTEAGSTSHFPPQSYHADASGPLVVFGRHFSNDNFTCLGQGQCKYQKFSTFLLHEKKMNSELSLELRQSGGLQMQQDPSTNENILPFFFKNQSENVQGHFFRALPTHITSLDVNQSKFCHGCQAGDRIPCSVRNVETMRICTMVDSVENSPGGPPKISQRAHHFLFTKETCVNMSDTNKDSRKPDFSAHHEEKTFGFRRPQGVKIQPLWTSTDSEERENTGNPSTCKVDLRNESSAETEPMQIEAPESQYAMLGTESCALNKEDAVDENVPPAAYDSNTEKARTKRMITEIPDINEELPGLQPAVSSTDGTEPTTSRVHSLDAKKLFPRGEQTSRTDLNNQRDRPVGLDATSRWIKRLKSSPNSLGVGSKSSTLEEASSHEKFSLFFNKIMKCNKVTLENVLSEHRGEDQMLLDQNMKSPRNGVSSLVSSKRKNQNMVLGCSWIQRWCRNSPTPLTRNSEPLVICEPHSLKFSQDELSKKQFPSIAAMALMGKAMNGVRACEFRKRGAIVVWNTNEY